MPRSGAFILIVYTEVAYLLLLTWPLSEKALFSLLGEAKHDSDTQWMGWAALTKGIYAFFRPIIWVSQYMILSSARDLCDTTMLLDIC